MDWNLALLLEKVSRIMHSVFRLNDSIAINKAHLSQNGFYSFLCVDQKSRKIWGKVCEL